MKILPYSPAAFDYMWLVSLMIIATYVRVHGAAPFHYNTDEIGFLDIAKGQNLQEVLRFSLYETHPPLSHILRHFWLLFGSTPDFMRSQSLLFGIALIPLFYLIGCQLSGDMMGKCAATLVTFSQGAIIQSYLLRNYSMLLFFIVLALYYYLQWKQDHKAFNLAAYTLSGTAVCLTHFSGIFAIVAMAVHETLRMFASKSPWQLQLRWFIVNSCLGMLTVALYIIWLPSLTYYNNYDYQALTGYKHLLSILLYPLIITFYFVPNSATLLALPFIPLALKNDRTWLPLFYLTCTAMIVGMVMLATGFYPLIEKRHSIWILPFVLLFLSWPLAKLCKNASENINRLSSLPGAQITAVILILGGWLLYSPFERFADADEYILTEQQWTPFEEFLSHLNSDHMIIADKIDAALIAPAEQNPYRYYSASSFSPGYSALALMPFHNTHILFDTYAYDFSHAKAFLDMMRAAQEHHIFDATDSFVIIGTVWATDSLRELAMCDVLNTQVKIFPQPDGPLTRQAIKHAHAFAVIIPKAVFFRDVLPANGKARQCFSQP